MHDLLLFRENLTDFHRWCTRLVKEAQAVIRAYEKGGFLYSDRDDYEDALKVQREFVALECSLSEEMRLYLEEELMESSVITNSAYYEEIYRNWREICFHKKHPKIRSLDSFMLGHRLRELRTIRCMTAAKVSGILKISSKSLYAYEEGTRKISADLLYRLSQIYGTSIDEMVSLSEHRSR